MDGDGPHVSFSPRARRCSPRPAPEPVGVPLAGGLAHLYSPPALQTHRRLHPAMNDLPSRQPKPISAAVQSAAAGLRSPRAKLPTALSTG